MFGLGALLARWRLKWILGAGLLSGVIRYACLALNDPVGVLTGITLHGVTYTLFFTTAQIYVNERMDSAWRARAQALLTLVTSGLGNFVGYLGTGLWFHVNSGDTGPRWPVFWGVLAALIAVVTTYFFAVYRGRMGDGASR